MIDLIKEFDLNFKNVYSIIGISKNSGKTTLLNYLIKNIEKIIKIILLHQLVMMENLLILLLKLKNLLFT